MNTKVAFVAVFVAVFGLRITSTESREVLKPAPDVEEVLKQFERFTDVPSIAAEDPPCSVHIQKDLPKGSAAQPIYLVPDTSLFWLPNDRGFLEVPRGASIELYCSSSFLNATQEGVHLKLPSSAHSLRPICLYDRSFFWQGRKYEFRHFSCSQPPKYLVERTTVTCADGSAALYRVGFNITRRRYVETMQICHDEEALRTYYTQHRLLPANLHFQRYVKRLNFSKAGHFKDHNINAYYTQQNQRQQAATALQGADATQNATMYFDNATLFLARGHLVAKSDQIYANQQRSTFTFFNAAPQWQSFNGGQWAQLEDEVRKFIASAHLDVDSYTGTWGTLHLPLVGYVNGTGVVGGSPVRRPFYLSYDKNNNGLLPVPLLFYRLLVDRNRPERGIVLIGVNNPHATLQQIQDECLICEDIKARVKWLKWIRNANLKKGYLYACEVPDFLSVVRSELPQKLTEVREILTEA